jgi:hypothetical protein
MPKGDIGAKAGSPRNDSSTDSTDPSHTQTSSRIHRTNVQLSLRSPDTMSRFFLANIASDSPMGNPTLATKALRWRISP